MQYNILALLYSDKLHNIIYIYYDKKQKSGNTQIVYDTKRKTSYFEFCYGKPCCHQPLLYKTVYKFQI